MAAEAAALGVLKGLKSSSVSMCVKLWTCFHCKLDADTAAGKGLFCASNQDHAHDNAHDNAGEAVSNELERRLKDSAPKGYRENTETARG